MSYKVGLEPSFFLFPKTQAGFFSFAGKDCHKETTAREEMETWGKLLVWCGNGGGACPGKGLQGDCQATPPIPPLTSLEPGAPSDLEGSLPPPPLKMILGEDPMFLLNNIHN